MILSMSRDNKNISQTSTLSFKDIQTQIEDFRKKRDDLNKKTKEYISALQEYDNDIEASLNLAKEEYRKKRDYWNKKVKSLKDKKNEYKKILDKLLKEKKELINKDKTEKEPRKFVSIKQIERKIENLERRIETETLNITDENAIVDQIRELAQVKQDYLGEQQNTEFIKLDRKIRIVKLNLNKIYEQLNKWSNKSQNYHAKMHEAYEVVNELRDKKKNLEEDLIENKKAADSYHEQFLKLMNQRKKASKGRYHHKSNKKPRTQYRTSSKRSDEMEKIKQEKLAEAIEKQKAGKKLNLYEARLILESRS
jgi:uncharacterized coiled-coil DUF342 family protein